MRVVYFVLIAGILVGCSSAGFVGVRSASSLALGKGRSPSTPGLVAVPLPTASVGAPCVSNVNCFYVDAVHGSDANNGLTQQSAFATLARSVQALSPGATVTVMSGTYTSNGIVVLQLNGVQGTPTQWIKYVAGPNQHPVVQLPIGSGAWNGIQLAGSAYVLIDGLEIVGQNQNITAAEGAANNGTQAWLNANCIFIGGLGGPGSYSPAAHDIIIRNSKLHDCSAAGLTVAPGADGITFINNDVYNNGWWTIGGSSGVDVFEMTDVVSVPTTGYTNYIVGNRMFRNYNNLPWPGGNPPGIYDGNGLIIDNNQHVGVPGAAYLGRTLIANNISYRNGGRGLHVYSSAHVDIINNTTYDNMLSTSTHITVGEIDAQASNDVNIFNNIAINTGTKLLDEEDGGTYGYNIWFGANVPYVGPYDLRAAPKLADVFLANFMPLQGSPALRSGTAQLAPAVDLLWRVRPASSIDRGAIQVSP